MDLFQALLYKATAISWGFLKTSPEGQAAATAFGRFLASNRRPADVTLRPMERCIPRQGGGLVRMSRDAVNLHIHPEGGDAYVVPRNAPLPAAAATLASAPADWTGSPVPTFPGDQVRLRNPLLEFDPHATSAEVARQELGGRGSPSTDGSKPTLVQKYARDILKRRGAGEPWVPVGPANRPESTLSGYKLHFDCPTLADCADVIDRIESVVSDRQIGLKAAAQTMNQSYKVVAYLPRAATAVADAAAIVKVMEGYAHDRPVPGDRHIGNGVSYRYEFRTNPGRDVPIAEFHANQGHFYAPHPQTTTPAPLPTGVAELGGAVRRLLVREGSPLQTRQGQRERFCG